MSTVHANTSRDALTRIENMVLMGAFGLPSKAIRTQIASAIDLIVQVERQRDGGRRLIQLTELVGMEGDVFTLNDIAMLEQMGEGENGQLRTRYRISMARPSFDERLSYFGQSEAWAQTLQDLSA